MSSSGVTRTAGVSSLEGEQGDIDLVPSAVDGKVVKWNDTTKQFEDATALLNAAYAAAGFPSAALAAGAVNRYDPRFNAYNFKASNTRNLRGGLAKAKAGTGSLKVACVGDSTVAGYQATPEKESWPVLLRNALAGLGFPIMGTGPVIGNPGGGPGGFTDGRYAFTGTWTSQAGNPNFLLSTTTNGATATFTSDQPGSIVEIRYLNNGGAFTYSIDGAAAVPVTPSGASSLGSVTVTGLAYGTHTVVITTTSTSNFYLVYVDVRDASSGVLVGNFGTNSTATADWTSGTFYFPGSVVQAWAPQVTFIELGINDLSGSVSTATYKANLQSLITSFKALGDVVLIIGNPTQSGDRSAYNAACYQLADSNDIPLIDLMDRLGTWASMNTLGLTADAAHPNAAGYAEKAAGVLAAITSGTVAAGFPPRGELGYVASTTDTTTTSATPAAVTGLSKTVTVGHRPIAVTFQGNIAQASAAGYCQVFIYMDGSQVANLNEYFATDQLGPNFPRRNGVRLTPSPGNHTFAVYLAASAGTSKVLTGSSLHIVEV